MVSLKNSRYWIGVLLMGILIAFPSVGSTKARSSADTRLRPKEIEKMKKAKKKFDEKSKGMQYPRKPYTAGIHVGSSNFEGIENESGNLSQVVWYIDTGTNIHFTKALTGGLKLTYLTELGKLSGGAVNQFSATLDLKHVFPVVGPDPYGQYKFLYISLAWGYSFTTVRYEKAHPPPILLDPFETFESWSSPTIRASVSVFHMEAAYQIFLVPKSGVQTGQMLSLGLRF